MATLIGFIVIILMIVVWAFATYWIGRTVARIIGKHNDFYDDLYDWKGLCFVIGVWLESVVVVLACVIHLIYCNRDAVGAFGNFVIHLFK